MPYTWEYPDRGGAMCRSCSQRFHASDGLVSGESTGAESEIRQARDGNAYSWWEFLAWYAEDAETAWNAAERLGVIRSRHHDLNAA